MLVTKTLYSSVLGNSPTCPGLTVLGTNKVIKIHEEFQIETTTTPPLHCLSSTVSWKKINGAWVAAETICKLKAEGRI